MSEVTIHSPTLHSPLPKGYKHTEVGVIPEDWNVGKIDDLAPFVTSGSRGWAKYYADDGDTFIRIGNLSRNSIYLDLGDVRRVRLPAESSERKRTQVRNGDLLISITADIGIIGYVDASIPKPAYINQHIAIVRFDDSKADSKFLSYFLASNPIQQLIHSAVDQGAKAGMNLAGVRAIQIVFPPLPEQRAIARALADADAWIEALERLIAKKRAAKQAAMGDLLTGRVRLPGFSGEWRQIRISDDSILKARIGWQGLKKEEYLSDGDYYLVTGTDFKLGRIDWTNCFFVSEWRYSQDPNIQLKPSDVLITKDGTIGKVAFVDALPGPATLNSGVFVVRPRSDSFAPRFLFYILSSAVFDDFLTKLQAGSTINHLYQKDFVDFHFEAPPTLAEQQAIAQVLSDIDAEIEALERERGKARAIKQGMMQELLTGRIRLVKRTPAARSDRIAQKAQRRNEAFLEAVLLSVITQSFSNKKYPIGRFRRTKLVYLLRRHIQAGVADYLKQAAGPYRPKTKYGNAEKIARQRQYVQTHQREDRKGFIPGPQVHEAEHYFKKWYGQEPLQWIEQFRYRKNEELELLTTVDMAMGELQTAGKPAHVTAIKTLIAKSEIWRSKLERAIFSDIKIAQAIREIRQFFLDR